MSTKILSFSELENQRQVDLLKEENRKLNFENQELRNKLLNWNQIGVNTGIIDQIY